MPTYKDDKTGRWYVKTYYTDYTGTKKQKFKRGFETQREAKQWEADFLSRMAAEPSMAFSALVEIYLDDKLQHTKRTTYETKKHRLEKWILPYFKNRPLDSITAADVRKWQADLKSATSDRGDQLSAGYIQNLFSELSGIFNFAIRFYGLTVNPCRIAGSSAGKRQRSMNFWTKEEFDRFIDTFDRDDPFYTAFLLLYYCGIRSGELMALTVSDIDLESGTLTVNKTYHKYRGEDIITPPKTENSNRTLLLPPFLIDCLSRYISRIYAPEEDTRLFLMPKAKYARRLDAHAEKAGVKRIRIHDLRHSNASLLIELGFSALLVAERLGHENASTTLNIYSHLFPSKQSEVVDRLEALCSHNDY